MLNLSYACPQIEELVVVIQHFFIDIIKNSKIVDRRRWERIPKIVVNISICWIYHVLTLKSKLRGHTSYYFCKLSRIARLLEDWVGKISNLKFRTKI